MPNYFDFGFAILPELLLAVAILLLIVLGSVMRTRLAAGTYSVISYVILLLGVVLSVSGDANFENDFVLISEYATLARVSILVLAIFAIRFSTSLTADARGNQFEYPVLALCAALGMLTMVIANDFVVLYLGLELQSLSLYIMIAFRRDSAAASEAALKYFVLGSVASAFYLFGTAFVYGATGSLSYDMGASSSLFYSSAGLAFIFAAFAFKVSAVPFHMWTPDVYQGAPSAVVAYFSSASKLAAFFVIFRLVYAAFAVQAEAVAQILLVLSLASLLVGSIGGLFQTDLKRLLGYSTIGQVGFILLGALAGTEQGLAAGIFYVVVYSFTSLGTFGLIMMLRRSYGGMEAIADFAGLSKRNWLAAMYLTVFMFSLAGVPPLAGFFTKYYVLQASISSGYVVVATIAVLTSVISLGYYLRVIKVMYFDSADEQGVPMNVYGSVIVGAIAAITFLLVIAPHEILRIAVEAAASIL